MQGEQISLAKVELNIGSNANPGERFKFQRKLSHRLGVE